MCGCAGTVNYPNEVILNILQTQAKRGPDSLNIVKSKVTFGHNLLAIIGHQEQPLEGERYLLTFNGEWYDFRDFYNATSDSIALLRHFEKRGLKAIDDINGMFSIGLYDKFEEKIHLFVDRFGQKPMYYYHEADKFAFSSNPSGLYQLRDKWKIDQDALQSYWLLGSVMGSDGLLSGIKKVTASERLTYDIRENKVTVDRYYEPKFQENTKGIEDLLLDAIRKVKVSDVPVHIFLSGGIDSTLVASQFEGGQAIHLDSPEYEFANRAAERFHVELKRVYPEDINVEESLTDFSKQAGEPCMAALIPYVTAKEVSKYGRVAVTANGADELFFGYDRTSDDMSFKQRDHLFRASFFGSGNTSFPISFFAGSFNGRMLELDYYVQYDLNKTLDFASMCHSLEVRSPFLDHRLVEMALSIPESEHRKRGNKTILKDMLRRMGFDSKFLDRPKLGFSLHKQPLNMDALIEKAWYWVQSEGFLRIDTKKLNGRDLKYLQMSALSFYYWYQTWQHKL